MRQRALPSILAAAACAAAVAAAVLGGGGPVARTPAPVRARATPVAQAECLAGPAPPKITADTLGVFRAGPLTLVLFRDLAQTSLAVLRRPDESVGGYVTVSGKRPVTLRVDPGSRRRVGLQVTAMSGYGPGLRAVRFPPCPGGEVIGGTVAVHAGGCARLHVSAPSPSPLPLLIPIANSLAGCPQPARPRQLPSSSFPYLGIRCHIANWAGCERIGVGVDLARPAILVTVQVDGHLVTLSPPSDPGSELWQGLLLGLGPHHGPLAVHARSGYWYGEPPVTPRVRVTAYFADGTAATRAGVGYLHAGYG